ncbi:hypothetical protein KCN56_02260 [Photobacterium galatheae]|uniref:hypothetical protein n=1 Tax=Photobacterium galatheae TaxID=1654360 RepID=UPI00202CE789|nr:hypothetical protein [Photobacterium galatheae]MCM0147391.1 hypothetical protein [Photobacterium galatheae]
MMSMDRACSEIERVVINELKSSDYQELLPLISPPHLGYVEEARLKRIFNPADPNTVTGLAIRASGKLVGAVGFIPQKRVSRSGKVVNTINLTCAVTHPDYRGYGLRTLSFLRQQFDDTLFTVLSASHTSDSVAKKFLKAKDESDRFQVIATLEPETDSCIDIYTGKEGFAFLTDDQKSIFFAHEELECEQHVLKSEEDVCFIVTRKATLCDMLCTEIVYYSNPDFLIRSKGTIAKYVTTYDQTQRCVISISDTPECLVDQSCQIMMREPRITFGLNEDVPFISLYSENLILGI